MSRLISRSASANASSLVIIVIFWQFYMAPALADRTLAKPCCQIAPTHIIRHSDLNLTLALSIAMLTFQHLAPFTWHC
jgi:hypothetical protein